MATEYTITPTVGHAPVPIQGGVGADPGFDAIDYRRYWSHRPKREGTVSDAAYRPHEATAGANMTVEVDTSAGGAAVQGDSVADQGLYYIPPHGVDVALDVTPADPSNARIDLVVLQVRDGDHDGSGAYDVRLVILTGTPSAGADLNNKDGAPVLPDSAMPVCYLRVPAGALQVANADISDFRVACSADGEVGDLKAIGGSPKWGELLCDGREVSRDVFADLYADIGTTYGAGDGFTTFELPDYRGRVFVAPDLGAGRLASADEPGNAGGTEKQALERAEIPIHLTDAGGPTPYAFGQASGPAELRLAGSGSALGNAHNNMQPYQVCGGVVIRA